MMPVHKSLIVFLGSLQLASHHLVHGLQLLEKRQVLGNLTKPWVKPIAHKEWGHSGGSILGVILGELRQHQHQHQHLHPIVLLPVAETSEVLFQDGI